MIQFMRLRQLTFIFIFTFSFSVDAKFTSDECIKSSFNTEINHDGNFFGLLKNKLSIVKKECVLKISFDNLLTTNWEIDICREPVHMKVLNKGMHSVYKRQRLCSEDDPAEYCDYWKDLSETMQDYGLIFAEGERELLTTKHGQVYCSFLLLKKYLGEGTLYSKYDKGQNIFTQKIQNPNSAKSDSKKKLLFQEAPKEKPIVKENLNTDKKTSEGNNLNDPKEKKRF